MSSGSFIELNDHLAETIAQRSCAISTSREDGTDSESFNGAEAVNKDVLVVEPRGVVEVGAPVGSQLDFKGGGIPDCFSVHQS